MAEFGGKVIRLELENFKSYRGHVVVGPFKQFSCIIGPNGSGKSNTMDALSFVLGVRASHLRGHNLKDLIYNVEGQPSPKTASVSLFFEQQPQAGPGRRVSSGGGREVVFKRTVKADGSTEYRIDNLVKSWEQYDEVLRSFQILTKARNFLVFQGDVENIAQKPPKDLTALLELVSGSDEFQSEWEERRRAKEEASTRLLDANARRREVTTEKTHYKVQKREVERFLELQKKLVSSKRESALFQLFYLELTLEAQKKALQAAREDLSVREQGKTVASKEQDTLQKRLAELHKQTLANLKASKEKTGRQRILQTQVDRLQVQVRHNEEKLTDAKSILEKIKKSGVQQSKEVSGLHQQLSDLTTKRDRFEAQRKVDQAQLQTEALSEEEYQEWLALKARAATQTITLTQEIASLTRQKANQEQLLKSAQLKLEQIAERARQLTENNDKIKERQRQAEEEIAKHKEESDSASAELTTLEATVAEREKEKEKIDKELSELALELTGLRFEKQETAKDAIAAEVLEQLKRLFPGTKGKLIELCSIPERRYRNAVTVAMGRNLDAIVVDNDTTALDCIRYLKDNRHPPMTFLPLESLKATPPSERLRSLGGTCRAVLSCIQFDPTIEVAVRYAVGNTLVCDALTEAKKIAFGEVDGNRYKVVTVDGTAILKNGTMQGGQATIERRARKWDDKAYEGKKNRRDWLVARRSAVTDLTQVRAAQLELNSKVVQAQAAFQAKTQDVAASKRRLQTNAKELDMLSKQTAELEPQEKQIKDSITELETAIHGLEAKKTAEEKKIFAPLAQRVRIADLERYDDRRTRLQQETAQQLSEYSVLINRLEQQIKLAEVKSGGRDLENMKKQIDTLQQGLKKDSAELGKAQAELDKLNEEIQKLNSDSEETKKAVDENTEKLKQLRAQQGSELDELSKAKKLVSQAEAQCGKLRSARATLLQRCRVEEVEIPVLSASEAATAARKRKAPARPGRGRRAAPGRGTAVVEPSQEEGMVEEEEEEEPQEELLESLDSSEPFSLVEPEREAPPVAGAAPRRVSGAAEVRCVDFSGLPEALRRAASSSKEYRARVARYEQEQDQATAEIQSLAPNVKATERFLGVQDRLEVISREYDQCLEASKAAEVAFGEINDKRRQRFTEMFDVLHVELDKVYKELTRDPTYPAGGTAYIVSEDPENPFNGGTKFTAMPPTKRYREIDQLSGGEKTVATLALLFTIQRIRPSPFFILDEVDAALDASNVQKVCRYVLDHARETQFIVISLKPEFFYHAEALVGVYKDADLQASRFLTWELTGYPDEAEHEEQHLAEGEAERTALIR